jgi:hypothetical protein
MVRFSAALPTFPRPSRDGAVVVLALLATACRGRTLEMAVVDAEAGPPPNADTAAPSPSPDAAPDVTAAPDVALAPDQGAPDHDPLLGFPPPGPQRLRGYLVFGNELHAYQSCGLPALTWVDLQGGEPGWDKLTGLADPCRPNDAGQVACAVQFIYVELDAVVSEPCRCGHLNKYERSLQVKELLLASPTPPADCPRTAPYFP